MTWTRTRPLLQLLPCPEGAGPPVEWVAAAGRRLRASSIGSATTSTTTPGRSRRCGGAFTSCATRATIRARPAMSSPTCSTGWTRRRNADEYVAIAYGEAKPLLIAAIRIHLDRLDPVSDEPSLRLLSQLVARQERHMEEMPVTARRTARRRGSRISARCRSAQGRAATAARDAAAGGAGPRRVRRGHRGRRPVPRATSCTSTTPSSTTCRSSRRSSATSSTA